MKKLVTIILTIILTINFSNIAVKAITKDTTISSNSTEEGNIKLKEQGYGFSQRFFLPSSTNGYYQFTNTSNQIIYFDTDNDVNSTYNIIRYGAFNNIIGFDLVDYGSISINPKETIRISSTNNNEVPIYIPAYLSTEMILNSTPLLIEEYVKKNEALEFQNVNGKIQVSSNDSLLKITKEENNTESITNYQYPNVLLPLGKTSTIVPKSCDTKIYIPYEFNGTYKKTQGQLLNSFEIKVNHSYEISNDSDKDITILPQGDFEAVTYLNGDVVDIYYNHSNNISNIKIPYKGKCILTLKSGFDNYIYYCSSSLVSYKEIPYTRLQAWNGFTSRGIRLTNSTQNKMKYLLILNAPSYQEADPVNIVSILNGVSSIKRNVTGISQDLTPSEEIEVLPTDPKDSFTLIAPFDLENDYVLLGYQPILDYSIPLNTSKTFYNNYNFTQTLEINNSLVNYNAQAIIYDKNGKVRKIETSNNVKLEPKEKAVIKTGVNPSLPSLDIKLSFPYRILVLEDICDVDRSGSVNIYDLSLVSRWYNYTESEYGNDFLYDLNFDGIVDIYDMIVVSKALNN